MPVAWFAAPMKRGTDPAGGGVTRYCAMDDFTAQILADAEYAGGEPWSECECLGNYALVKVRASAGLLQTINAATGFQRIPASALDNTLASLTTQQKTALKNFVLSLGYTVAELQARFPNDLGTYTLRDVLRFMLTRRLQPRYDQPTDTIVLDGSEQACRPVEDADAAVA